MCLILAESETSGNIVTELSRHCRHVATPISRLMAFSTNHMMSFLSSISTNHRKPSAHLFFFNNFPSIHQPYLLCSYFIVSLLSFVFRVLISQPDIPFAMTGELTMLSGVSALALLSLLGPTIITQFLPPLLLLSLHLLTFIFSCSSFHCLYILHMFILDTNVLFAFWLFWWSAWVWDLCLKHITGPHTLIFYDTFSGVIQRMLLFRCIIFWWYRISTFLHCQFQFFFDSICRKLPWLFTDHYWFVLLVINQMFNSSLEHFFFSKL